MKKIALIGCTGSIGKQTLNVCRRHPDKFKIVSLAGGNNHGEFLSQVEEFKPMVATLACNLEDGVKLPDGVQFSCGEDAFTDAIINEADIVVPNSVKVIGANAFASHAFLREIVIDGNVKLINRDAFKGCTSVFMIKAAENSIAYHYAMAQGMHFVKK